MNKEELFELFKEYYYCFDYAYKMNKKEVASIIEEILIKHKFELNELEAKVNIYEKIITNSNFKAINNKSIDNLNKKIKELEKQIDILKGE